MKRSTIKQQMLKNLRAAAAAKPNEAPKKAVRTVTLYM